MLKIIRDKEFSQLKSIDHAFYTRKGGVSKGFFASLNCHYAKGENPNDVTENLIRAMAELGYSLEALRSVKMVHGDKVLIVDSSWQAQSLADAMVTKQKDVVLALDSADCPIVLFADEVAQVIGIAHAGWKGAKLGILENTIEKMVFLGAKPQQISATIGPCISQESYEVDADFYQQFIDEHDANKVYFDFSKKPDHYMFSIADYVKSKLLQLNLQSVSNLDLDTYRNEEDFFSYRRACHRQEEDFGGHLSCIFFKSIS